MSKVLQLKNTNTFIAPATNGVNMVKGQTARFTDAVASKLTKGFKVDKEGEKLPYFVEAPEGTEPDFDFTEPQDIATASTPPVVPQPEAAVKKVVQRQRAPRAQVAADVDA